MLIEDYDEKMRYIKDLLANEAKHQQSAIEAKLALRRAKKKRADDRADEKISDKLQRLEAMKSERSQLAKEAAAKFNIQDEEKKLKQEMETAKVEANKKIESEKNHKLQEMRNELLAKLKGAETEQEKAAILEELQRKQKSIEDEMEEERLHQERMLRKKLKALTEKRRQELRREARKEVDEKTEQMRELRDEIDQARMMAFAESAGTALEDQQKRKAVDMANELRDPADPMELTPYDKDALQVQRAKHDREKELAEKRVEVELDEELNTM